MDLPDARTKRREDLQLRWLETKQTNERLREVGKRLFDILFSTLALIVLMPLLIGLWVAIRLDSAGPAIFRQCRIGRDEKPFICFKFRTLDHNADEAVHRAAIERLWAGERLSSEPGVPYKLTDDGRVTRVGRRLRRTSLDELPQLVNVLRGEMSIVGPRPAIPYELQHFRDWHHKRHNVKPGITGLWQVRGRGRVDLETMLALDVEYASNWNLWTDLKLIALTIPAVLMSRGAR